MPLVRYEIPNEFRIANPIVYKDVPKHDAVALLESITMSALAGTVRQIGELSDLAAEVFGGLHEAILAISTRERGLCSRLELLESQLPELERSAFAEDDQLKYAFTPGVEWHSKSCIDQSHFSRGGDLPPFVQKCYEECSGPPCFYKVDKFEVAGPGVTLRRYTDPSYFRTEWAKSQLLKAENARRACKEKKLKQQAVHSVSKESLNASKIIHRVDSFKYPCEKSIPNPMQIREDLLSRSRGPTLKISAAEIEATTLLRNSRPDSDKVACADSPDQFVDALATMEPETDKETSEKIASYTEAWNLDAEVQEVISKPSVEPQVTDNDKGMPPAVTAASPISGSNSASPVTETSSEEANLLRQSKVSLYSSTSSFSSPDSVDSRLSGAEHSLSSTLSEASVHQAFSALDSPMSPVGEGFDLGCRLQCSIFYSMKQLTPTSPTSSPPPGSLDEKMPTPPPFPPSKWMVSRSPVKAPAPVRRVPTPPPPPLPTLENGRLHKSPGDIVSEHRDLLLDSITTHSMDKLRKVGIHTRARSRSLDSRDELLEQIRTGSFNLKHAQTDAASRPPVSSPADINVAAILEKASAIRQALEGSDDDEEDWAA